jgi:serine/threonine protein kinase
VVYLFFPLPLPITIMVKGCPAYPILKILGSGAFGQVYLSKPSTSEEVRDRAIAVVLPGAILTRQLVAVKVIKTTIGSAKPTDALKEVDLLRRLSHPNIVEFIELIQSETRIYVVMEYCGGGDLRDMLNGRIDVR